LCLGISPVVSVSKQRIRRWNWGMVKSRAGFWMVSEGFILERSNLMDMELRRFDGEISGANTK